MSNNVTRVPIDNANDPRLAVYRDLPRRRTHEHKTQFVVEGSFLTQRLLASNYPVESLVATPRGAPRLEAMIPPEIPLYVVSESDIRTLVGFDFHRGVLGCGRRVPVPPLGELLASQTGRFTVVLLPQIQNEENLGGILRVCGAFGVDGVLLGPSCADHLSRRALRVSMGGGLQLPVLRTVSIIDSIGALRNQWGFQIAATVVDDSAETLDNATRPARFGIVLGPEDHGLDDDTIDACDRAITIPMPGSADSLNVTVAAGLFLYQLCARR